MSWLRPSVFFLALSAGCGGSDAGTGTQSGSPGVPTSQAASTFGDAHSGQFHEGPVDFRESQFHNACAPGGGYRQNLRDAIGLGGEFLAGVQTGQISGGALCEGCIQIDTAKGRSIVARVVTYGDTGINDIDVSPSVYAQLNTGEYPRSMTWRWAKCPDTGTLRYEFQTEANVWWTSFWVRNPRVPVTKVEVKSANHKSFFTLRRESDGTLNDDGGFGEGEFTLRLTGMDGQTITDTFASFSAGQLLVSTQQFQ
jgi:hypothetical protein